MCHGHSWNLRKIHTFQLPFSSARASHFLDAEILTFHRCPWCTWDIDPIHAAAMTDKKRGLGCRFTANLRIRT